MALVNFNQSITVTAQSNIDNKVALYMNAAIPQEGSISVNKSIQDRNLYFNNETECNNDYAEFNQRVEELARGMVE